MASESHDKVNTALLVLIAIDMATLSYHVYPIVNRKKNTRVIVCTMYSIQDSIQDSVAGTYACTAYQVNSTLPYRTRVTLIVILVCTAYNIIQVLYE